jgi:hypothetical protein
MQAASGERDADEEEEDDENNSQLLKGRPFHPHPDISTTVNPRVSSSLSSLTGNFFRTDIFKVRGGIFHFCCYFLKYIERSQEERKLCKQSFTNS